MMVVSRIKYYKNISTPRHPAWFLYYRSTVFPTQTFRDLLIGSYDPRDVIVLTDSGYDNKKIQNAIVNKHWQFIMALGKTRSVKSEKLYLTTSKSKQWCHIALFFRHHRWLK